jgi:uncharacterized protein YciI
MHYVLSFEYVEDMAERRLPYRAKHLALASAAHERGELLLAGAYSEAPTGAILIFRADGPTVVERFVAADPYVQNGLVTRWAVRPLQVVIGG